MSKTRRKRKRTRVNADKRTIDELVSIIKKLQEREESLLVRIDDLEFYIETLELELFDDGDSEGKVVSIDEPFKDFNPETTQEAIQLHTMDEVLKELGEEKKEKKSGKGKKKRRKK